MKKIKSSLLCCLFTGVLILMFSSIVYASNLTITEDRTLADDLTVDGDLYLSDVALNLDGHKLTVNGDVIMNGDDQPTLDIAGGTLNVTGYLIQQAGDLEANYGTINIGKDYRIQTRNGSNGSYSYGLSRGWLTMQSPGGTINIDGSFFIDSNTYGYLEAGTMKIKGNFTQMSSTNNGRGDDFNASEGHKVILCGTGEQDISFDDPTESGFGMLDITQGTTRDIVFKTPVRGWTLEQDLKVKGDLGLADKQMSLNKHHLTVTGDVVISSEADGALDIAGGTLDVTGSLIQQAGELKAESGSVNIGVDCRVQSRALSGGNYVYGTSKGWLTMKSPGGTFNIDGNFYIDSITYGYLDAGTMKIKGNFTQMSSTNNGRGDDFNATEGHKVILCGAGEQDVSFEDPTESGFGMLDITNGTTRDIVFKTPVRGWALEKDLKVKGDLSLADKQMSLNKHHLTVNGDVVLNSEAEGALDIAGGTLEVTGSLIQQDGEIKAESGVATIVGDYRVQSRTLSGGDCVYGNSKGWLTMLSPGGTINIDGNFFIDSTTYGYLEAGTMKIKGNFTQMSSTSDSRADNFNASEGHKVVLCGTGEQNVSFDDPTESSFGTLAIVSPVNRIKYLTDYHYKKIITDSGTSAVVKSISADPKVLNMVVNDNENPVIITAHYAGDVDDEDVTASTTWKSSNPKILEVLSSDEGVTFYAKAKGAAKLTATFGGKTTTVNVKVTPEITGFEVSISSPLALIKGKKQAVKAYIYFEDGSKVDVTKLTTWESGDSYVATVIGGVITGAGKGETTVTGSYGKLTFEIPVKVIPVVKSISADPTSLTMSIDDDEENPLTITAHFTGKDEDEDVTDSTTWKSSNVKILKVLTSDEGVTFQAIAKGTAKLTATFGGKSIKINVTVTE